MQKPYHKTDSSLNDDQHLGDENYIVGIDLGTTNSLIGLKILDKIEFCEEHESCLIPSIVSFEGNGKVLVGKAAAERKAFKSIKRFMGKSKADASTNYETTDDVNLLKFATKHGSKNATEISAEILKHLKQLAEAKFRKPILKAVITVPAYFNERARTVTRDAANIAGLEVVRIMSEPTAAAIAYSFDDEKEGIFAVYDLGGGTFDVSVLRIEQGILQVIATKGDIELGGDDFDEVIYNIIEAKSNKNIAFEAIQTLCKMIKEYLSINDVWIGTIDNLPYEITRIEFENACEIHLKSTIDIFDSALKDAKISAFDLNQIILVGGATRMPCVKKAIIDHFNIKPIDTIDPDKIVAYGAILQAYNLANPKSKNRLLLDVTPLSLKIELADNITETIIAKNTQIPVVKRKIFTTQVDNQTGFIIHVLQGESEFADKCKSLAKFELKIGTTLDCRMKLEVTFQIDADGLLIVKCKELNSDIVKEVLIKPDYGFINS